MPKTLLVFPPGWSPVGPYLALPVLKSYLQEVEQYKVDIVDLNVEFYDDLLSFRHVEECCKRYRESKDSFSSNVQLTDRANFCGVRGRAASAPPAPKAIPQRRGGQGPPL